MSDVAPTPTPSRTPTRRRSPQEREEIRDLLLSLRDGLYGNEFQEGALTAINKRLDRAEQRDEQRAREWTSFQAALPGSINVAVSASRDQRTIARVRHFNAWAITVGGMVIATVIAAIIVMIIKLQ